MCLTPSRLRIVLFNLSSRFSIDSEAPASESRENLGDKCIEICLQQAQTFHHTMVWSLYYLSYFKEKRYINI